MTESPSPARIAVAFDGSLNANWVARYAMRVAAAMDTELLLVHVADGNIAEDLFEQRRARLLHECANAGISVRRCDVASSGDVARAILDVVPRGPDSLLLCGARARAHGAGWLSGSVAERLLRAGHCAVIALRVLAPGLLGHTRRLLLPLAGWPGESRDAVSVLRPLLAGTEQLHLLRVMEVAARVIDHASRAELERLRGHARAAVTDSERELRATLDLDRIHVDAHVRLDQGWAHAATVVARVYDCNLLLAGGSERQLGVTGGKPAPVERLLANAPCDVGIYRAPG